MNIFTMSVCFVVTVVYVNGMPTEEVAKLTSAPDPVKEGAAEREEDSGAVSMKSFPEMPQEVTNLANYNKDGNIRIPPHRMMVTKYRSAEVIQNIKSIREPKCTYMSVDCTSNTKDCFTLMCYVNKIDTSSNDFDIYDGP